MLSMHDNEQYFFEALKAGASGYVLKSAADRDLVEACRAAMRGEPFLYPAAVAALIRDYLDRAGRGEATPTDPLTPRELEIVKLVAEGHTSDEIAEALVISQEDRRAPPQPHPREARDARPRRADPLRHPARAGRALNNGGMATIYVTGHRNPDTDSIASAIGYAELKRRLDPRHEYVPVRLGDVNAQTRWVLERAGAAGARVPAPHHAARARRHARRASRRPATASRSAASG